MLIETLKKFYEARLKELQKDLGYISSKRNARSLILASFLFVVLVIFCSSFEPRLVFFAPLPPIILFSVVKYLVKKRKNEIEYYLTDALFQASSLSDFAAIEEIVKTISESNYGALSEEFSKVYKEIKTGSSFEDAIMKMCKRNRSRIVERSMSILLSGYQTGSRISEALRETAEDISQTFDIHRQRAASMTIEKYTLLLAGG